MRALNAFELLGHVYQVLPRYGYIEPTPIQTRAIPVILSGNHTLIVAPTGSGKTEAAVLPVFELMMRRGARPLSAVYVTPLRALNRDVFLRLQRLAGDLGISMALRHGDTPRNARKRIAENPPHIVVTTPETLQYLLLDKRLRSRFRNLRWVIVDEVHELVSSKRGSELVVVLERLSLLASSRIQRIGLSATLRDPVSAAAFLAGNRLAVIVEDPGTRRTSINVHVAGRGDPLEAEALGVSPETLGRIKLVARLIDEAKGKVLVFTNTRDTAEFLASKLKMMLGEDAVAVHHGSLSRDERLRVEEGFRSGSLRVLVATSSMELGIDIGEVDLVVQYGSPRQVLRMLQRVGRSRHRRGREARGVIVSLGNIDDIAESLVIARRTMSGDIESVEPYNKPLDALMHQIAGILIERGEVPLKDLLELLNNTYPYSDLSMDELSRLAEHMDRVGVARFNGKTLRRGRRIYSYYYSVSMIPDSRRYIVVDATTNHRIGSLDEEFVISRVEPGMTIVLGARLWRIVGVEDGKVIVEPSEGVEGVLPAWEGDLIPVEYPVAREVCSLFRRLSSETPGGYPGQDALSLIRKRVMEHLEKGYPLPHERLVLVESLPRLVIVHACLGSRGAEVLGMLLSDILSSRTGLSTSYHVSPYRVIIAAPRRIPSDQVVDVLEDLASRVQELEDMVRRTARKTGMYLWRLLHVAKRMGLISPGAERELTRNMLRRMGETLAGLEAFKELLHDKIDLKAVKALFEEIRRGSVRLVGIDLVEPTPLGRIALESTRFYDRVPQSMPLNILAELVRRRLSSRRVRLICMHCGFHWDTLVSEVPERPRCPRCGSGFLAPTGPWDNESPALVAEAISGRKFRGRKWLRLRELRRAGGLVLNYGKPAIIALSAKGIGPQTAVRVLSRLKLGEEEFYRAIFEAEKEYIRTRKYWD